MNFLTKKACSIFWIGCFCFLTIYLFMPLKLNGQKWETLVEDQFENSIFWGSHCVANDHDGVVIAGSFASGNGNGLEGIFLAKVDTSGNQVWRHTYNDSSPVQRGHDVVKASDGGFGIIGMSQLLDPKNDIYLIKTDSEGEMLWSEYYDFDAIDVGKTLLPTSDGGFLLAGRTSGDVEQLPVPASVFDIILVKVDADGAIQWSNTFDAGFMRQEGSSDIIQTSDMGYLILGYSSTPDAGFRPYLIRLDTSGQILWEKLVFFEEFTSFLPFSICETSDGNFIISGFSKDSDGLFETELALSKIDGEGNVLWRSKRDHLAEAFEFFHDVVETADGGFLAAGFVSEPLVGNFYESLGYLAKFDSEGMFLCEEIFEDVTAFVSLISLENGNQIITGVTHDMTINGDTYVMCWPNDYCPVAPTSTYETFYSSKFNLFPQPMTTYAFFEFDSKSSSAGLFSLFDISGKQVLQASFEGNSYTLQRNNLVAGAYLFQVIIQDDLYTGKLLVID